MKELNKCAFVSRLASYIPLLSICRNYLEIRIADFYNSVRQGVIGSFQGFYQFIYYSWLDKVFSGVSVTIVAKKVILDEVLIGPISLVIFFLYNGFCDTCSMAGAVERCRQSFLSGYLSDLVYWPILQTVNFAFVPPAYRVLYVIFFTSLWDTYLCLINTRMSCSGPQKNENEEKVTTVET
ncbi:Mpv17-like protein isoform 2 [Schistosoma japonicum]|uniref:Mitochondrial inner membrane protein Mpv17 n=1 Tax=Schistosoma japonicum TaxID=6182 RepID=A0A4Z2CLB9_SCHJA|nr:Mpv17-like protein isoform 2 [Schistosoma japonicum]